MVLMAAPEVCAGGVPAAQARPASADLTCQTRSNTVDTGGPRCGGPIVYSARDKATLARKNVLVQEFMAMRAGKLAYSAFARDWQAFMRQYGGPTATHDVAPRCLGSCDWKLLTMPQQSQTTTYYCGPASASEALSARSISKSQSTLAGNSYLNTSPQYGTGWGPPYVMPTTLNDFVGSGFYEAVDAYDSQTDNTTSTFESDLLTDINSGWPVVIGIAEFANTDPHLVGHPRDLTIYHWVAANGYFSSGADVNYDDSIHGDTQFWSWASNVPASSEFATSDMNTLMAQGGYGWVW